MVKCFNDQSQMVVRKNRWICPQCGTVRERGPSRYHFQRHDIMTKEEVAKMIEAIPDEPAKALFAFLYVFGCRIGEALQVTKEDIKVNEKTMTARIPTLKTRAKGPIPPSRKDSVSLSSPFVDIFLAHLGKVSQGKLWSISRVTAWRWIKRVNSQSSPHIFRHTRATKLADASGDAFAIQEWFGWKTMSMAMHYIHLSGRGAAKLSGKID